MTTLYGIKNCDTIKKAKKWLEQSDIVFAFHDYRADGLDADFLQHAESVLGWESLLNKRGTTFRGLDEDVKNNLNREVAIQLMLEHPAMIKRPLLVHNDEMHLGFKDAQYQEIFS